jgi:hypothetical protein
MSAGTFNLSKSYEHFRAGKVVEQFLWLALKKMLPSLSQTRVGQEMASATPLRRLNASS